MFHLTTAALQGVSPQITFKLALPERVAWVSKATVWYLALAENITVYLKIKPLVVVYCTEPDPFATFHHQL
jgi:hypothetical protein